MTEEEAKTKWCPQARQSSDSIYTYNRGDDGTGSHSCRCLGSACMAWRLAERMFGEVTNNGYCGLAGRP